MRTYRSCFDSTSAITVLVKALVRDPIQNSECSVAFSLKSGPSPFTWPKPRENTVFPPLTRDTDSPTILLHAMACLMNLSNSRSSGVVEETSIINSETNREYIANNESSITSTIVMTFQYKIHSLICNCKLFQLLSDTALENWHL